MIVTAVAAATASAGLVLFDDVADRIEPIPDLPAAELTPAASGDPYTILLLGSDRRPDLPDERSDTTMLLRLDPGRRVAALLSLPRDLLVSIPGVGYEKLNAAYAEGGPRLVLRTVRTLTGLRINAVVDVDFKGFADAVDAVGCVYVDVDRKYLVPPNSGYAAIDINAGYQRLCGLKALQYVRYRHTDNDIVRAARQQAFLREARQRLSVRRIVFGGGSKLLDAFTDNARSTIDSGSTLRQIATSIFDLRGVSLDQIRVSGDLGDEDIRAGGREIDRAVRRFLNGPPGPERDRASGRDGGRSSSARARRARRALPEADPQFARYAATAARRLGMPVFYPRRVAPGTAFSRDSRTYDYEDEDGKRRRAYKLVMTHPQPQIATEYYGVTGTSWGDPPILRNPSELREIDGREYLLFYAGRTLRLVGWKQGGNSFWVSNSLLGSLSEQQMLGIAASMAQA